MTDQPPTPPEDPSTPPPAGPASPRPPGTPTPAPPGRPTPPPPGGPAATAGATAAPEAPAEEGSIESPSGGPRRLLIAGVVAAVVFVALVVVTRGDDTGGGCIGGLADHLGADVEVIGGSDYERADDAGLDVDDLDGLVDASVEASFLPDPVTAQVVRSLGGGDPESVTGYAPGDVDCWLGREVERSFVARGDFDADRVADAELADDLAVDGDLVAYDGDGDPDRWFDEPGGDSTVRDAVRELDDMGAITFSSVPGGDDVDGLVWIGLGLARDGDDWQLLAVWAFEDPDRAEAAVDTVVGAIEEGEVPSMIEGDVADQLDRDGSLLTLQAPMAVEPSEWRTPFVQLDPMFGALLDFGDDDEGEDSEGEDSEGEGSEGDGSEGDGSEGDGSEGDGG